ncbi:MAG TPA: rhodanese-related sulfurtransferase [Bacillales bacterium]|nr:rhodanese-related sulfurtransferase [Bacillales bacterium]
MESQMDYRVLLYYKYVPIEDHETFAREHLDFCKELGLRGRILVAEEGLNGTVSGTVAQTDVYMETLRKDPRFSDIEFKIDPADGHAFKKMFVRARDEIVSLKLEEDVNPNKLTGEYLDPKDFYEELQKDDVVVLDARNEYEYRIGHFRGAINPDIESFRELPKWIEENLKDKKDKRVLAYCTGGIRCEKLTGYLKKEGFENVAQLHGGIVTYGKDPEVKGRLYEGKCYVFDDRRMVPVNRTEEDRVIGECFHCGKTEDRYVNCANPECNRQYICCESCETKYKRSCSDECREHERNRYGQVHG